MAPAVLTSVPIALGGLAAGVYLTGEAMGGNSNYWFTLLGELGGIALSIPPVFLLTSAESTHGEEFRNVAAISIVSIFTIAGTLIGYELANKPKKSLSQSSTFNINVSPTTYADGGVVTATGIFNL